MSQLLRKCFSEVDLFPGWLQYVPIVQNSLRYLLYMHFLNECFPGSFSINGNISPIFDVSKLIGTYWSYALWGEWKFSFCQYTPACHCLTFPFMGKERKLLSKHTSGREWKEEVLMICHRYDTKKSLDSPLWLHHLLYELASAKEVFYPLSHPFIILRNRGACAFGYVMLCWLENNIIWAGLL